MPVKRRISKVRDDRITPEAVEAFATAINLRRAREHEKDGGPTEEYREAYMALYFATGQKPWQCSPLDVEENLRCPEWHSPESWKRAQELRRELMEAIR